MKPRTKLDRAAIKLQKQRLSLSRTAITVIALKGIKWRRIAGTDTVWLYKGTANDTHVNGGVTTCLLGGVKVGHQLKS